MSNRILKSSDTQYVVDDIQRSLPFMPRMSAYCGIKTPNRPTYVKRRAKFAPDLLAEGLSTGVVTSANTLLHGYFDEDGVSAVDRHVNIQSDKFENMAMELVAPSPDPSSSPKADNVE